MALTAAEIAVGAGPLRMKKFPSCAEVGTPGTVAGSQLITGGYPRAGVVVGSKILICSMSTVEIKFVEPAQLGRMVTVFPVIVLMLAASAVGVPGAVGPVPVGRPTDAGAGTSLFPIQSETKVARASTARWICVSPPRIFVWSAFAAAVVERRGNPVGAERVVSYGKARLESNRNASGTPTLFSGASLARTIRNAQVCATTSPKFVAGMGQPGFASDGYTNRAPACFASR